MRKRLRDVVCVGFELVDLSGATFPRRWALMPRDGRMTAGAGPWQARAGGIEPRTVCL